MDGHKASWILEFLLRQAVEGSLAGGSLGRLPVPPVLDPRLRKTILFRRLSSDLAAGDLSGDTLQSLEILEELDRALGAAQASESLKAAYCAVAAELTAAPLRSGGPADFFEAVNGIWNCRVGDLERSEGRGLMGEALREWRRRMEEAVVSDAAREWVRQQDTRGEAMEALKEYLRVAVKEVRPSQLELAANRVGRRSSNKGIDQGAGKREATREPGVSAEPNDADDAAQLNRPAAVTAGERALLVPETAKTRKRMLSGRRETPGEDRILKELGFLPIPEVNRAKEALKSSLAELQRAVVDPLPNALSRAAEVQDCMVAKLANSNDATNGQYEMDVGAPEPSIQIDVQATVTERVAAEDCNEILHPTKPRPTLMDRNPTARTYETQEIKKIVRRRKARRWSPQEEDALREAVKKYGKGNWKLILQHNRGTFGDRTEVDLKDKWRNMTRCDLYVLMEQGVNALWPQISLWFSFDHKASCSSLNWRVRYSKHFGDIS